MSKKKKPKAEKDQIKELALEIDLMDDMLSVIVDVLERKGIVTSEEWEKEVKAKIETNAKRLQSFREVES